MIQCGQEQILEIKVEQQAQLMSTPTHLPETEYQPSSEQAMRAANLKRFNRQYIYFPLGLAILISLLLLGGLSWQIFTADGSQSRQFASGLADIIIILTTIPLLLLCAIVPATALGYTVYRRQLGNQRQHGRLLTMLWRIDHIITRTHQKTDETLPKAAAPLIKGHGFIAFLKELWRQLRALLNRS